MATVAAKAPVTAERRVRTDLDDRLPKPFSMKPPRMNILKRLGFPCQHFAERNKESTDYADNLDPQIG
ncbi:hypothetical protein Bca101_063862 [Brassica carinata]